ncbi:beta-propeller fold lactonase family protein [bacterium]|nr:beta-propeller fold lactonase family protein [bacterium]
MLLVQPNQSNIAAGTSQQFQATLFVSDGTQLDVTPAVQWESSDPSVASVGSDGLARGLTQGTATIRAQGQNLSSAATLTVSAARLVSLSLAPTAASTPAGLAQQFTATGLFTNGARQDLTSQVDWTVLDGTVASINASGLATALKVGTTRVKAEFGSLTAETGWNVSNARLDTLRVTPADALTAPGSSRRYQAFADFSDHTTREVTQEVTWESSAPSVTFTNPAAADEAKVSEDALPAQNATIRASLSGVQASAQLRLGQFAYVAFSAVSTFGGVGAYSISNQGALSKLNFLSNTQFSNWVAVEPTGRFAYVANQLNDSVSLYRIQSDGNLVSNGPDVPAGNAAFFDIAHPNGKVLYVANAAGQSVSSFTIGDDGKLTALEPSVPCGNGPRSIALAPSGRFLYVANFDSSNISVFSINDLGILTPLQTVATGAGAWTVAVHPSGQFLFVTNRNADTIGRYLVDPDGKLSLLGATPMPDFAGALPTSMVLHHNGGFAYVTSHFHHYVAVFSIDGNGGLTYLNKATDVSTPDGIALDASSRYLLVPDRTALKLFSYSADLLGGLTRLSQAVEDGISSVSVTTTP